MPNKKYEIQFRRWFGVFVCIGWIHLIWAIYPLPFELHSEIDTLAKQAVDAERSLAGQGISKTNLSENSKEEWINGLKLHYWISWLKNIVFLLSGVVGSVMAYQGRKNWQWVVGIASSILLISTCYPWFGTEHFVHTMSLLFRTLFKDGIISNNLSLGYIIFAQPIYHFCILIGTILLWRNADKFDND